MGRCEPALKSTGWYAALSNIRDPWVGARNLVPRDRRSREVGSKLFNRLPCTSEWSTSSKLDVFYQSVIETGFRSDDE